MTVTPLPFTWPYAVIFWIVFIWAFVPERALVKNARRDVSADDAGSMRLILIGNQLAMFFGIAAAWFVPETTFPKRELPFWIGMLLLAGGALLRQHCFHVLGRFFSGAVIVRPDHQVVDRGAYRWVRHPSYTAGMIMFLGIALTMGNWITVVLMTAIPMIVYSYRVAVEERALLLRIGEPYRSYIRSRKRFIPFII